MAYQATVKTEPSASLNGMLGGIGNLGGDLVTLTSLQARLAAEDFRQCIDRAFPALIATAIIVPLGFAGMTIVLLGLAYWITGSLGWTLASSLLLVGGVGIVLSAALGLYVVQRIQGSFSTFRRSGEEFERNVTWLRTVMMHSGR